MTTEPVTERFASSMSDVIVAVLSDEGNVAHLSPSHEALLAARLAIDEALGVHAHWDTTSPAGAITIVKGHMRRRYPELTEDALHALALHSTRDWRRSGL